MKYLNINQVLKFYQEIILKTGGTFGIRDLSSLDSAINAPNHTFDTVQIFPSIEEKAARLAFGIISNHPFVDGNKRVAAHTMLIFLALNDIWLDYKQDELVSIVFRVASSEADYHDLVSWIKNHKVIS